MIRKRTKEVEIKPTAYRSKIDDPHFADPEFGKVVAIELVAVCGLAYSLLRVVVMTANEFGLLDWARIE